MKQNECFCGGVPPGAPVRECCGPALEAEQWPRTAEALMRSRYSAFVTNNEDHLFRTWHPRFRPAHFGIDPNTVWTGLTILNVEAGQEQDSVGVVEFEASYTEDGREQVLRERSRFSKRAGRWMYEEAF
ncbi:YchJ family protein [Micrococcoides hystricis]|uniref:YchJ family protein n=1 Tax=Micrococcoides hystricis TaxID=1572761 RepID=A0ABV6P8F8_9MICC